MNERILVYLYETLNKIKSHVLIRTASLKCISYPMIISLHNDRVLWNWH